MLALPLVVRAFGVIASAFGIILVRSDETSSVSSALLRGYLSTTVISLSGLWGISYWLFGEHFLAVSASGALGLLAVLLAAHALLLRLGRRSSAIRDSQRGPAHRRRRAGQRRAWQRAWKPRFCRCRSSVRRWQRQPALVHTAA